MSGGLGEWRGSWRLALGAEVRRCRAGEERTGQRQRSEGGWSGVWLHDVSAVVAKWGERQAGWCLCLQQRWLGAAAGVACARCVGDAMEAR